MQASQTSAQPANCPICWDLFPENEAAKTVDNNPTAIKCGHVFHEFCINKWLKTNSTCPLCRTVVVQHQPNEEAMMIPRVAFSPFSPLRHLGRSASREADNFVYGPTIGYWLVPNLFYVDSERGFQPTPLVLHELGGHLNF